MKFALVEDQVTGTQYNVTAATTELALSWLAEHGPVMETFQFDPRYFEFTYGQPETAEVISGDGMLGEFNVSVKVFDTPDLSHTVINRSFNIPGAK